MTMPAKHRPMVLVIRDGWGSNPHPEWNHANAVHLAHAGGRSVDGDVSARPDPHLRT